jgi:hypothetical protein
LPYCLFPVKRRRISAAAAAAVAAAAGGGNVAAAGNITVPQLATTNALKFGFSPPSAVGNSVRTWNLSSYNYILLISYFFCP